MMPKLPTRDISRFILPAIATLLTLSHPAWAEPGTFKKYKPLRENEVISQRTFTNEQGQTLHEKLEVYGLISPNGTEAWRITTNEQGKPVQIIYYSSSVRRWGPPKTEDDIYPTSMEIYCYDAAGRETWKGNYSPGWILQRSAETSYGAHGEKVSQYRDADSPLAAEVHFAEGRSRSHISFDDSGREIMVIQGELPPGKDIPSGWGKEFDGLACGVGLNRRAGKLQDIRFHVMVRNLTASDQEVVSCLPYQEIETELRGASGQIVPQAKEHIRKRDAQLREMNGGSNESSKILSANKIASYNGGYDLKDWYSDLLPGTYSLTVKRRATGPAFSLMSIPVEIRIQ